LSGLGQALETVRLLLSQDQAPAEKVCDVLQPGVMVCDVDVPEPDPDAGVGEDARYRRA
jgi:hypothetical protein